MNRTGKYRIIAISKNSSSDPGGTYYWTPEKDWSLLKESAKIFSWEEKWAMKELPRYGIWEEIPWGE